MTLMVEREVKLRFESPDEARAAILAAGAAPLRCRRLQEDALFDTEDEILRRRRCALRVRTEAGKSLLTFKGPVQPGTMKIRDEYKQSSPTAPCCSTCSKSSACMCGSATRSTAKNTRPKT